MSLRGASEQDGRAKFGPRKIIIYLIIFKAIFRKKRKFSGLYIRPKDLKGHSITPIET